MHLQHEISGNDSDLVTRMQFRGMGSTSGTDAGACTARPGSCHGSSRNPAYGVQVAREPELARRQPRRRGLSTLLAQRVIVPDVTRARAFSVPRVRQAA
ncbi:hypothetical protein QE377_001596 [Microbacterium sp. SORGH_AS 862]|nr:hypothetical protein [Microbacterium sp. SORGH_AS_0862]